MAKEVSLVIKTQGGEETLKNINDITTAIKKLEEESKNMDLGSDAFENSKNQIDELKKKHQELTKSQQQLDKETADRANRSVEEHAQRAERIGSNVQKFAAGLTDAFAGAFIALGASEKDAEKLNKTLQQGVGIALGVKGGIEAIVAGVQLAGPAFEAFNAIISANPIGAVVVAVAALVAGIYLLTKALNSEEKESEKLTKQLEEQKVAAESLSKVRQSEISVIESKLGLMRAQGKSDSEILQATKDLYEAKRKALEQDLVQLELAVNITKARLQEVLAEDSLTESYYKKSAAVARGLGQEKQALLYDYLAKQEKINNSKEITDQLLKDLTAVKEYRDKIAVLDIQKETEVANIKNTINEKNKKSDEEKRKSKEEEFKRERERLSQELKDGDDAAEYLGRLEKQKADEKQYWIDYEKEQIDKANADKLNQSLELYAKQKAAQEKYEQELYDGIQKFGEIISNNFSKLDTASGDLAAGITTNLTTAFKVIANESSTNLEKVTAGLNAINGMLSAVNQYNNQVAEENVKKNQESLDDQLTSLSDAREAELAKEGLTNDQKTAINNKYAQQEYELKLAEYNKNTEIKKKAFEQDKKLKIAQTVISTITGAVAALTGMISAVPGPVGIVLGAVAAAAVVATGAIQVAAINKQKFDAGSPPAAPKLQVPSSSGSDGVPTNAQQGPDLYSINGDTNTGQGGSNKRTSNEPIKAYVVSQEVTSSQNMNAVIERRSSF